MDLKLESVKMKRNSSYKVTKSENVFRYMHPHIDRKPEINPEVW